MTMTPDELNAAMQKYIAWRQRGIPPLTSAQMDTFLADALDVARKELLEDRGLDPFARLIVPGPLDKEISAAARTSVVSEGPLSVLHYSLDLSEDSAKRHLQFGVLRFVCQSLAAMAVIIISDAWTLRDPVTKSLGVSESAMEFASQHGSVAAANAGKGILTEVITASIQTKERMITKMIPYERVLKGGAVLSQNGRNPLGTSHTVRILDNDALVKRYPEDGALAPGSRIVILYGG